MAKEGIQSLALGRKDLLRIDPRDLKTRPDWNCRDIDFNPEDADDLALAESIAAVGVKQPLTAIWQDGQAFITDGHRRLAAALYAIDKLGAEIKSVPVQTEDRYTSEAEQVLSQIVRNNGKPLSPIEHARVYKRLLDLGWKEREIAEKIGRTVAWVKSLLELHVAPSEVTDMVRKGEVSATLAISTIKKAKGDKQAAADTLAKAVKKAKASGKTKATGKHVEKPEKRSLHDLADESALAREGRLGQAFKHKKTGELYAVVGVHFREADMVMCVEYRPLDFPRSVAFARPLTEFDARFEKIEGRDSEDLA